MIVDLTRFPCSYCKKRIDKSEDAKMCPHCNVVMHKKCWDENKGCTTPGCKGRFNAAAAAQSKPAPMPVDPKKVDPFHGLDRKQEERARQLLQQYGLEGLENADDINAVRRITAELAGTNLMEAGMLISSLIGEKNTSVSDRLQVYFQRAIIEQNFILIRQIDRLNSNIEKLFNK